MSNETTNNVQTVIPVVAKPNWSNEKLFAELVNFRTNHPDKTKSDWLVYVTANMNTSQRPAGKSIEEFIDSKVNSEKISRRAYIKRMKELGQHDKAQFQQDKLNKAAFAKGRAAGSGKKQDKYDMEFASEVETVRDLLSQIPTTEVSHPDMAPSA